MKGFWVIKIKLSENLKESCFVIECLRCKNRSPLVYGKYTHNALQFENLEEAEDFIHVNMADKEMLRLQPRPFFIRTDSLLSRFIENIKKSNFYKKMSKIHK